MGFIWVKYSQNGARDLKQLPIQSYECADVCGFHSLQISFLATKKKNQKKHKNKKSAPQGKHLVNEKKYSVTGDHHTVEIMASKCFPPPKKVINMCHT